MWAFFIIFNFILADSVVFTCFGFGGSISFVIFAEDCIEEDAFKVFRDEGTVLLAPISAFISSFSFPFAERFSIFEIKVAIINPNSKNREKDMREG